MRMHQSQAVDCSKLQVRVWEGEGGEEGGGRRGRGREDGVGERGGRCGEEGREEGVYEKVKVEYAMDGVRCAPQLPVPPPLPGHS